MVGMSHGGGLNSHGTDAESFPSEHETDQMGHSVAIHAIEEGLSSRGSCFIYNYRRCLFMD